jgi:16S rRNA (adenine1518-N6/adenine1519-N6)-dimethyltransferase
MTAAGDLDALPPLRQVIAEHGLAAKKSLGQNFLLDLNLTRRIARAGGPLENCHVIEIGPGPGGLTRALLLEGAARVTVVERDSRAIPALREIAEIAGGRLEIVEADALSIDQEMLVCGPEPVRVVANLPYNIATPLLTGWLCPPAWPSWWQSLTLMFQREVAERIIASPGGKSYGRLSVLAGWRCTARILFDVPRQAFTPPPKVTSSIVRLEPRADAVAVPPAALESITAAAFGQRRKMLRSSLKSIWPEPETVLEPLGIDPSRRAETVPVADFVRMAQIYAKQS